MKNRFRWAYAIRFLGLFLIAIGFLIGGCSRHPKATSRESMEFIKQVYTACNTKNTQRLSACEERLEELESSKKMSKAEVDSFKRVLKLASEGKWDSAQSMALQYAKDQIR